MTLIFFRGGNGSSEKLAICPKYTAFADPGVMFCSGLIQEPKIVNSILVAK